MGVAAKWSCIIVLLLITTAGCTSTDTGEVADGEAVATLSSAADTVWAEATAEGLAWDVPGTFNPVVPSSTMRIVQYELPSTARKVRPGELALFFFGPGVGGTAMSNLDRWTSQFRQPDRSDSKGKAVVESFVTDGGLKVTTIRLEGIYEPPSMNEKPGFDFPGWALYGAVIEGEGGPWFFKAVGPGTVMDRYLGALEELYRGVRLSP